MRRHDTSGESLDRLIAVPRDAVADAAETPAADPDLGLQHLAHPGAEGQVGGADYPLSNAARAVPAGGAHRGEAIDELDLADRHHFGRAVLTVHRAALEEDGRDYVVPPADIGQELRQQVAPALRCVPKMMVR